MSQRFSSQVEHEWFRRVKANREAHPNATGKDRGLLKAINSAGKELVEEMTAMQASHDALVTALEEIAKLDYARAATNGCACMAHEIAVTALDEANAAKLAH